MAVIRCRRCAEPYPHQGLPYICPACGGTFDFDAPPDFSPERIEPGLPGYWRYRHAFSLFHGAPVISLGEGNTPLLWLTDDDGRKIGMKMESLNPSGSFKDRGSAVLVSQLLARGAESAVEDSSGNAGASFAAYAARAGIRARIFVPESASGPKRVQIENYGAELIPVPGPRIEAAKAVLNEVKRGAIYASHAYMPMGIAGLATIAYEIVEQLGAAPKTVFAPSGHGGLMLGLVRGFAALKNAGVIKNLPYYVGVQSQGCAPLAAAFQGGLEAIQDIPESPTIAEGVRVRYPVQAEALIREIPPHGGTYVTVLEDELLAAYHLLAQRGFYVEPTAALVWAACQKLKNGLPDPIVLILTGLGLKANYSS